MRAGILGAAGCSSQPPGAQSDGEVGREDLERQTGASQFELQFLIGHFLGMPCLVLLD